MIPHFDATFDIYEVCTSEFRYALLMYRLGNYVVDWPNFWWKNNRIAYRLPVFHYLGCSKKTDECSDLSDSSRTEVDLDVLFTMGWQKFWRSIFITHESAISRKNIIINFCENTVGYRDF